MRWGRWALRSSGSVVTSWLSVSGALFLLIVIACALAPVYSRYIAHTGPNSQHISDVIKVGGKAEERGEPDRRADRADVALEVLAGRRSEWP